MRSSHFPSSKLFLEFVYYNVIPFRSVFYVLLYIESRLQHLIGIFLYVY